MKTDDTNVAAQPRRRRRWPWYIAIVFTFLCAWQFVGWVTPMPTPLASAAAVTDKVYEAVYDDDIAKAAAALPKEVNILVVGLDNRLASTDNHADAIHLITIRTKDSVGATITSIPRGTEVTGYGIDDDLSFMANVRALKGRKTFMKAVAKLCHKRSIDYYVEVTFSQVMGVLELLGYKDPATALQFLRHRKSYALGDVQRSYNQGKFLRQQVIRRGDLLTGAKGDLLIRMGLGMVDTDLNLETAQALVYTLKHADAMNESHIALTMMPRINLARLDSVAVPDPDQVADVVNKLVRRTGEQIDDLGRYNPYPKMHEIVQRAAGQSSAKAVIAQLEPIYVQKAWLQVQERPLRRAIRDSVEDLMVRAYTALKQPAKANDVTKYMAEERKAFSETEREDRRFSYGMRQVKHHDKPDQAAIKRARIDNIGQKQTHVESTPTIDGASASTPKEEHHEEAPRQESPKQEAPKHEAPAEPTVHDIKPDGGKP
ncbi:MAG: Transcriptional regulator LytR [Chlorobi bacterium]|nr:Transcriptional regulator LytR [Chlorobiota bacterium]